MKTSSRMISVFLQTMCAVSFVSRTVNAQSQVDLSGTTPLPPCVNEVTGLRLINARNNKDKGPVPNQLNYWNTPQLFNVRVDTKSCPNQAPIASVRVIFIGSGVIQSRCERTEPYSIFGKSNPVTDGDLPNALAKYNSRSIKRGVRRNNNNDCVNCFDPGNYVIRAVPFSTPRCGINDGAVRNNSRGKALIKRARIATCRNTVRGFYLINTRTDLMGFEIPYAGVKVLPTVIDLLPLDSPSGLNIIPLFASCHRYEVQSMYIESSLTGKMKCIANDAEPNELVNRFILYDDGELLSAFQRTLYSGIERLKATPYYGPGCTGVKGRAATQQFKVQICPHALTNLYIVPRDNRYGGFKLPFDFGVIPSSSLDTVGVGVDYLPCFGTNGSNYIFGPPLSSMKIEIDGSVVECRENRTQDFFFDLLAGRSLGLGLHTIKVTPFADMGCRGLAFGVRETQFTIT